MKNQPAYPWGSKFYLNATEGMWREVDRWEYFRAYESVEKISWVGMEAIRFLVVTPPAKIDPSKVTT